jgi:hypothetical protein
MDTKHTTKTNSIKTQHRQLKVIDKTEGEIKNGHLRDTGNIGPQALDVVSI